MVTSLVGSWWLDLSREQFAERVRLDAQRMACDKHRKLYRPNPEFTAPRARRPTVYNYALEAARVE